MLRPTPGDPWGVEQHHWNTGAEENQQLILKSSCALCLRFSVCFCILITSVGEEGAGLCGSRKFVCFARVCFCPFSLPLGVEGWLRFMIVAYPGPFYYFFLSSDEKL